MGGEGGGVGEAAPLAGGEVREAVLLAAVVGALVEAPHGVGLDLLVAVPVGILPPAETKGRLVSPNVPGGLVQLGCNSSMQVRGQSARWCLSPSIPASNGR